ncbi:MAG: amidohydrolase family protein, partial [Acidimicrobiia bacterium]
ISDADQHFYEGPDTIVPYLDPEHRHKFRYIEVDGRTQLLLNDRLYKLIPDPTYSKVSAPGSMEQYFRGNNPDGKTLGQIAGRPITLEPSMRYPEPRLQVLDEQGVDLCIMLPTQVLGLEIMLWEDPAAMVNCVRALNRWTHENWTWNIDNRVFTTGIVSLIDPVAAEKELEILIEQGCKVIGMRSGPIQLPGVWRSPADPIYDRFWSRFTEAGLVLGMHSADTTYSRHPAEWGESGVWIGHKPSPLAEIMGIHTVRPVSDTMAAFVAHGLFARQPKLKVAVLELGSLWIRELVARMKIAYGKTPQLFTGDPIEQFLEHVWVMPFFEDDLTDLVKYFPVEHIVYGSDWPHPEGFADPQDYIGDLKSFSEREQKMIMRDNLRNLVFGAS